MPPFNFFLLRLLLLCSDFTLIQSKLGEKIRSEEQYGRFTHDTTSHVISHNRQHNRKKNDFPLRNHGIDDIDSSTFNASSNTSSTENSLSRDESDIESRFKNLTRNDQFEIMSRIVNGSPSYQGEYPFMASILTTNGYGRSGHSHACGGTLIAPNVVLCAAHCLFSGTAKYVRLGMHYTTNTYMTELIKIVEYKVCPQWDRSNFNCDIALLRLKRSSTKQPIEVSFTNELQPNSKLTVIGWGTVSHGGKMATKLMDADMYPMDQSECRNRYGSYLTENMFCATPNGKDACQGDSGGPIIKKRTTTAPARQVGIVSWGVECAHSYYPGVYARLHTSVAKNFINDGVCNWSPDSCYQGKISSTKKKNVVVNTSSSFSTSNWGHKFRFNFKH